MGSAAKDLLRGTGHANERSADRKKSGEQLEKFDTDKDGALDVDEFEKAFFDRNKDGTIDDLERKRAELQVKADENDDGQVTRQELTAKASRDRLARLAANGLVIMFVRCYLAVRWVDWYSVVLVIDLDA